MRLWRWIVVCFLVLIFGNLVAEGNAALLLKVKGGVGPAVAEYIAQGITQAEKTHANIIVIQLDTPGGLDKSMREIIQSILSSKIPVATYVSPSGARAASAGTFILYASPIAAMAPGTKLGAASPVALGMGQGAKDNKASTSMKKAKNDAVAYIQSLAEFHNRNKTWAKLAVTEAESLSAEQALKKNIINIIAPTTKSLLNQINGQSVKLQSGKVQLQTQNATVTEFKPSWRIQVLSVIASPTIAYILLLVGMYGIIFEFLNPGLIAPGVIGVVCVLFAAYGLHLLPVSFVGLLLLLLGVLLMAAELFVTSFGILAVAGIIAFFFGSLLLFDKNLPGFHIALSVIITITVITAIFFLVLMRIAVKSQRRPVVSGGDALIGVEGKVLSIGDGIILALVEGESWQVKSNDVLSKGDSVQVLSRDSLILNVKKI